MEVTRRRFARLGLLCVGAVAALIAFCGPSIAQVTSRTVQTVIPTPVPRSVNLTATPPPGTYSYTLTLLGYAYSSAACDFENLTGSGATFQAKTAFDAQNLLPYTQDGYYKQGGGMTTGGAISNSGQYVFNTVGASYLDFVLTGVGNGSASISCVPSYASESALITASGLPNNVNVLNPNAFPTPIPWTVPSPAPVQIVQGAPSPCPTSPNGCNVLLSGSTQILTKTALGSNAVFTSAWNDTSSGQRSIDVSSYADQAGSFVIQQSDDTTNSNLTVTVGCSNNTNTACASGTYSTSAATLALTGSIYIGHRYWRIVYTNGATAQASFELAVTAAQNVRSVYFPSPQPVNCISGCSGGGSSATPIPWAWSSPEPNAQAVPTPAATSFPQNATPPPSTDSYTFDAGNRAYGMLQCDIENLDGTTVVSTYTNNVLGNPYANNSPVSVFQAGNVVSGLTANGPFSVPLNGTEFFNLVVTTPGASGTAAALNCRPYYFSLPMFNYDGQQNIGMKINAVASPIPVTTTPPVPYATPAPQTGLTPPPAGVFTVAEGHCIYSTTAGTATSGYIYPEQCDANLNHKVSVQNTPGVSVQNTPGVTVQNTPGVACVSGCPTPIPTIPPYTPAATPSPHAAQTLAPTSAYLEARLGNNLFGGVISCLLSQPVGVDVSASGWNTLVNEATNQGIYVCGWDANADVTNTASVNWYFGQVVGQTNHCTGTTVPSQIGGTYSFNVGQGAVRSSPFAQWGTTVGDALCVHLSAAQTVHFTIYELQM